MLTVSLVVMVFGNTFPSLFLFCRIVQGIAVGVFTTLVPLLRTYTTKCVVREISPVIISGAIGTIPQICVLGPLIG